MTTRTLTKSDVWVPVMLLVLSTVPILGGVARLTSLTAPSTAANARFLAAPAPVILHIVSAAIYCVLGAFQFSSGFRSRWPRWHRRVGKLVALCGLSTAITGLWMTERYAIPRDLQGPITHAVRLMVGVGMASAICLAWFSILRREFARHGAWMIRAYALGQGAGTQALVLGPWMVLTGQSGGSTRDVLMSVAWALNLLAAEWIIRGRDASSSAPRAPRALAGAWQPSSPRR